MHTEHDQVEADGELTVLRDKGRKGSCGGCLPNFVQRHGERLVGIELNGAIEASGGCRCALIWPIAPV